MTKKMALTTEEIGAGLFLSPLLLLKIHGSQCIFGTATNYKALNFTVTESFVINDYYNDCELLCTPMLLGVRQLML